jgi:hypothetical protein
VSWLGELAGSFVPKSRDIVEESRGLDTESRDFPAKSRDSTPQKPAA